MYQKNVTFQLPVDDYESIRDIAHNTHGTLAALLREGALLVLEKYKNRAIGKQDQKKEASYAN